MSGEIFQLSEGLADVDFSSHNLMLCYLCNEQYEDPCILSCYHSFCARCLRGRGLDTKMICPMCGGSTMLKDGQTLTQPDVLLKFLVDSASDDTTLCANCDKDKKQMFFCNTCSQPLCSDCREETHRAQMFSRHEIVLISKRTKDIHKQCGSNENKCNMAVKSSGAKAPKLPDGTALWVKLNRGVWWPGFVLGNAATFFDEENEVLIPLKNDNHRIWEEDSHRVKTSLGKLSVKDRKMYRLHLDRIRSLRSKQNADPMEILTSMEPSLADPSSTLDKRPNVALPTETAGADCNISPEKENADLPPETSVVSYILHTKDDVGPETTVSDSRMMPAKKKPRGDNVVLQTEKNAVPMEILTSMEPSLADPSSTLDKRPNVALPTETAGADCNQSPEKENADLPPETAVISYIPLHTKDDVGAETTVLDSCMTRAKKRLRGDKVVLPTETNAVPMEILTSMEPSLADPSSTLDKRPNVALPTETAGPDCNISPEKETSDLPSENAVVSYILHTKDDVGAETTVSDSRMMPAKKKPRGDNVVLQTEKNAVPMEILTSMEPSLADPSSTLDKRPNVALPTETAGADCNQSPEKENADLPPETAVISYIPLHTKDDVGAETTVLDSRMTRAKKRLRGDKVVLPTETNAVPMEILNSMEPPVADPSSTQSKLRNIALPTETSEDDCNISPRKKNADLQSETAVFWCMPQTEVDRDDDYVSNSCNEDSDPDYVYEYNADSDDTDDDMSVVYSINETMIGFSLHQEEDEITETVEDVAIHEEKDSPPQKEQVAPDEEDDDPPQKRQVAPGDCVMDDKYPKVFMKEFKTGNTNSKHNRRYDCVHACLFCRDLLTNIQTHLENKHAHREEVEDILKIKQKIKVTIDVAEKNSLADQLKKSLVLLRNRGNNRHNMSVLKFKEGEILLSRRKKGKFVLEDYGPCPQCEEWILVKTSLTNHRKTCPQRESSANEHWHKGSSIIQIGILTGMIKKSGSKRLMNEVIPSMKRDAVTQTAMTEPLITTLGDIWLMKNIDNKRKRKYYASFHMRLAARLLTLLRNMDGEADGTFMNFLKPAKFDLFVECALKACCADPDKENEVLDHPSTAIKLGFDIGRLASSKLGYCIKLGDDKGRQEATDFINLIKLEWSTKVTKIARVTLSERQFNNKKDLPDPHDIAKLAAYLVEELHNFKPTHKNPGMFRRACMLVETRLLLYNRRRPGELEALSLEYYHNRSTVVSETDQSLRHNMSALDKKMLICQELIEIRGKNGTRVSVICPEEVIPVMAYLADPITRQKSGIKMQNTYFFANSAMGVVRAGESIEEISMECGLKYPHRVHATNLRKHCATIAQIMGLKENEMKWLCNHLGHTVKVHETHYRSTSGLIERLEIAKLMLIQEKNIVGKFAGQSLSEIRFEDIMENENDQNEVPPEVSPDQDPAIGGINDIDLLQDDGNDSFNRLKKKADRQRWNKEEEDELMTLFPSYFNNTNSKTCPSRNECFDAIKQSSLLKGKIHTRKWDTIKKKVNNMMLKKNK